MKRLFFVCLLGLAFLRGVEAQGNTYTSNFPVGENPISEAGHWVNGKVVGLDWANARTIPGLAYGTQSGTQTGLSMYSDSTALLTGVWGPDQTVQATVHTVNQNSGIYEEVAIRLRSAISAHSSTGYEVGFRCTNDGSQYLGVTRWNGPLGDFTSFPNATGPGLNDGDVIKATIVGSVITAYINGNQVYQVTDSTFSTGRPGMGFFLSGASGVNADYGFTSFTASDGGTVPSPPSAPTNLRIVKG
jgi:hypothetical protein